MSRLWTTSDALIRWPRMLSCPFKPNPNPLAAGSVGEHKTSHGASDEQSEQANAKAPSAGCAFAIIHVRDRGSLSL